MTTPRIERVPAEERPAALARLAVAFGQRCGSRAEILALEALVGLPSLRFDAFRVQRSATATYLGVLRFPGRSAMLLPMVGPVNQVNPDDLTALATHAVSEFASRKDAFAQALLHPHDARTAACLVAAGLRCVTTLRYLQRDATFPWTEPPRADECAWRPYDPGVHGAFIRTLAQTYVESNDCPELSETRTPEEALETHRAGALFDASLWELAVIGDEPCGCVLLAPVFGGSMLEVAYMGVSAGWRKRGIGALLLRRALAQCRARGARRLTLAVDDRNDAARRLYDRFGFSEAAQRTAWLWSHRARPGASDSARVP